MGGCFRCLRPLPSLGFSIYMSVVCNKGKGHYLWASGYRHNPFCMHGYEEHCTDHAWVTGFHKGERELTQGSLRDI